jgi:hypothetical protein
LDGCCVAAQGGDVQGLQEIVKRVSKQRLNVVFDGSQPKMLCLNGITMAVCCRVKEREKGVWDA